MFIEHEPYGTVGRKIRENCLTRICRSGAYLLLMIIIHKKVYISHSIYIYW